MDLTIFQNMPLWELGLYLLLTVIAIRAMDTYLVLIHEAGHALAGLCFGMTSPTISVKPGDCSFAETSENAKIYARPLVRMVIAVSGALSNFVVGGLLLLIAHATLKFGYSSQIFLLFLLVVFAILNIFNSLLIFIPRKEPEQDNAEMRTAWGEYRASLVPKTKAD